MLRKISVLGLIFVLAFVFFSCKKKAQIKGLSLDVSFSEEELSDNLITEMKIKLGTSDEFMKMSEDLNVYVHFWHDSNLLFQADFIPDVNTSTWEPGNEYVFTQKIHIPPFIDEFDPDFKGEESLRLNIGFFSPYDKTGESKQEIYDQKIKVFPPPLDTPEIIYEEGWYDLEINPEAFLKRWRWTTKEARCLIDNPHRDALLVIKGGLNLEVLQDQKVVFKINDLILDEFVGEESYFEKSYDVKKEMLGEADEFYLTIATDKIFIPAEIIPDSTDERELGLQVSFLYFR